MKKLIFLSFSYPYSQNYSWKKNELDALKDEFEVMIIPYLQSTENPLPDLPAKIRVALPVLSKPIATKWLDVTYGLSSRFYFYMQEFVCRKVFIKSSWMFEWIGAIKRTEGLLKHPLIRELIRKKPENQETILYFYWGAGLEIIIPFLRNSGYKKIIVRYHGFDLYEDRNLDYIPFRKQVLKKLDHAIFISQHGLDYLTARYPDVKFNAHLFRLGCKNGQISQSSTDGILRIVSCSNVIDIKRLELIAESLKKLYMKIQWTHLGDGVLFEDLKEKVKEFPPNIITHFTGRVDSEEVGRYYYDNPVDLFVNVSSTEGVPVSIMEAFASGIPVFATDVGGTSEIVNNSNGRLLPPDISADDLAEAIREFHDLDAEEINVLRKSARDSYEMNCNFDKLNREFIDFLKRLE